MRKNTYVQIEFPYELLISLSLMQESWEFLNGLQHSLDERHLVEKYFCSSKDRVQSICKQNPHFLYYLIDLSKHQNEKYIFLGGALEEMMGLKVSQADAVKSGILIGSIGHTASGKGTLSRILRDNYDFYPIEISSIIVVITVFTLGVRSPNRSQISSIAGELKRVFGPDIFFRMMYRFLFIYKEKYTRFMIDGVRNESVAKNIKQMAGSIINDAVLFGIHTGKNGEADQLTRFNRSQMRGDSKDAISFEEFKRLDHAEFVDISNAWKYVDYELINDEENHFLDQITAIMVSLV